MKSLHFTLIILFLPLTSSAQIFYHDQPPVSSGAEFKTIVERSQMLWDSLLQDSSRVKTMDIFEINNELYLTAEGKFSVYKWQNGRWSHHYKGRYYGYNYHSKKFVNNNTIYSYGGYGFWRLHGEIIRYMPDRKEWEILEKSKALSYGAACACNDTLYILNRRSKSFDLVNNKVIDTDKEIQYDVHESLRPNSVELKNYCLVVLAHNNYLLFDKLNKKTWFSNLKPFEGIKNGYATNAFVHLVGDSMSIFHPDGWTRHYTLDQEIQYFTLLERPRLFDRPISWVLSFLAVIIAIPVFFRLRQKMETPASEGHDPVVQGLITTFESRKGETLSVNEIDKVLRIDDVRISETRRFRRSKYIKAINDTYQSRSGHTLIERKRDPSDRRKYVYIIQ